MLLSDVLKTLAEVIAHDAAQAELDVWLFGHAGEADAELFAPEDSVVAAMAR